MLFLVTPIVIIIIWKFFTKCSYNNINNNYDDDDDDDDDNNLQHKDWDHYYYLHDLNYRYIRDIPKQKNETETETEINYINYINYLTNINYPYQTDNIPIVQEEITDDFIDFESLGYYYYSD